MGKVPGFRKGTGRYHEPQRFSFFCLTYLSVECLLVWSQTMEIEASLLTEQGWGTAAPKYFLKVGLTYHRLKLFVHYKPCIEFHGLFAREESGSLARAYQILSTWKLCIKWMCVSFENRTLSLLKTKLYYAFQNVCEILSTFLNSLRLPGCYKHW